MSTDMKNGSASFKAPEDVLSIAKHVSYEDYTINVVYKYGSIIRVLNCIWQIIRIKKYIPKGSTILYQYPDFHPLSMLFVMFFLRMPISAIIHDINSLRNSGHIIWYERQLLKRFNCLIVHTTAMENFLKNDCNIVNVKYYVLNAFPYLAEVDTNGRENEPNVCFAGNIDKSKFLPDFFALNTKIKINLYGNKKNTDVSMFKNVSYNGYFSPNNVIGLKGSWGLVWDGDTVNTCSGLMGNYHKIIAPHKFSLFVVSGMPVVVWSKSAMSDLVKQKKIGICVDSISNLFEVLISISDAEYKQYQLNIIKYAKEVLALGINLREILLAI